MKSVNDKIHYKDIVILYVKPYANSKSYSNDLKLLIHVRTSNGHAYAIDSLFQISFLYLLIKCGVTFKEPKYGWNIHYECYIVNFEVLWLWFQFLGKEKEMLLSMVIQLWDVSMLQGKVLSYSSFPSLYLKACSNELTLDYIYILVEKVFNSRTLKLRIEFWPLKTSICWQHSAVTLVLHLRLLPFCWTVSMGLKKSQSYHGCEHNLTDLTLFALRELLAATLWTDAGVWD